MTGQTADHVVPRLEFDRAVALATVAEENVRPDSRIASDYTAFG